MGKEIFSEVGRVGRRNGRIRLESSSLAPEPSLLSFSCPESFHIFSSAKTT